MVEYKEGAESAPIKHKLPVLVIVYSLQEDDKVVIQRMINYSDFDDRKWLGKISYWAYSNHCSVETMAISDAEAENINES